jgi:hypothetical protein
MESAATIFLLSCLSGLTGASLAEPTEALRCEDGTLIDAFDADTCPLWRRTMAHGDLGDTRAGLDGNVPGGALRVEYDFPTHRVNHVGFGREVRLDLSGCSGLAMDVCADGRPVRLYLVLLDGEGRRDVWWVREDVTTCEGWTRCEVDFRRSRIEQRDGADLSDVREVRLFLLGTEPTSGTVWFDNLASFVDETHLEVSPARISPNGDGLYDRVAVEGFLRPGSRLDVEVLDESGDAVGVLAREVTASEADGVLASWCGLLEGRTAPAGRYTLRLTLCGAENRTQLAPVEVVSLPPWPRAEYEVESVFPVGVFVHLSKERSGIPDEDEGARAFLDRHFSRIAEAGFNLVCVSHASQTHWERILSAADRHGLKVILDAAPLIWMLSRPPYEVAELEAAREAARLRDRLAGHDSFFRYALYDEPRMEQMPGWQVIQRILAEKDPRHPAFSVLTWEQTVSFLRERTNLPELCVDIYPFAEAFRRDGAEGLERFGERLGEYLRLADGRDLWVVHQAFSMPGYRLPTPRELRAATWVSLARGAKGAIYFTYFGWPDRADRVRGLVDADGEPAALFTPVSELAWELSDLADLLKALRPAGPIECFGAAVAGSFVDSSGRPVVIAANPSASEPAEIVLGVLADGAWRDVRDGMTFDVHGGRLELTLAPAGRRVLVHAGGD